MNKPREKSFKIDDMASKYEHSVLRLPLYHPELNSIEKIWGIVKNWVASRNVTFKLSDVKALAEEKFRSVGRNELNNVCKSVKRIEQEMVEREHIIDEATERFIIRLSGDSESDDDIDNTPMDEGDFLDVCELSSNDV